MSEERRPNIFEWRNAFLSEYGPKDPNTRYLLLTLSTFMDKDGSNAFPSFDTLAARTGLSRATVARKMPAAHTEGWIDRTPRGKQGRQGWKRWTYTATIPPRVEKLLQRHGSNAVSETDHVASKAVSPCDHLGSNAVSQSDRGGLNSDNKVVSLCDSTSSNTSKNTSSNTPTSVTLEEYLIVAKCGHGGGLNGDYEIRGELPLGMIEEVCKAKGISTEGKSYGQMIFALREAGVKII